MYTIDSVYPAQTCILNTPSPECLYAYKITQAGNPIDKGIDQLFKEGSVHTAICIS